MGVYLGGSRIKISVNTDISVIEFYGYVINIGGYFYKNISKIKITLKSINIFVFIYDNYFL